ncbi:hypothetical protein [Streptomyces bambusae]|uniref:Uncharacterized protein n=1 Tax=Streptomyces bambusae TaxID=1550616 RepID=A0ABS6Z2I5_9ACTN|nr:hypothetical protein [Streptomyces bambusae]MBW5481952.1 hypothetical protein [Streptomyces bambusae]
MTYMPEVEVEAPDDLGFRKVVVNGKNAGKARSPAELHRILGHHGVPFPHDIHWVGGGEDVWPDHPVRRRTTIAFMAIGLLGVAALLAYLGVEDVFSALGYGWRIAGLVFLLLGLMELGAALAAADYWHKRWMKHSGTVVLFGYLIAFVVGVLLLCVQLIDEVSVAHVLAWTALVLWSSVALVVLVRERIWKELLHPRRIAVGAIVPTVLAISSVVYSQFYVPYTTSPMVESAAEIRMASLDTGRTKMYLTVHLYVKNSGKIPVYVLGGVYWVHGRLARGSSYEPIHPAEFVKPTGLVLNPGEEFAKDEVVEIKEPCGFRYEAVRVRPEVYVARKDRMTLISSEYEHSGRYRGKLKEEGKDKDPEGPTGEYFRYQASISNSNEILDVIRGPQRVTLWWVLHGARPYMYADVTPSGERKKIDFNDPVGNKEANDRYGLVRLPGSVTQASFVELLKRAQTVCSTQPSRPGS